ncbi:hypothetical protein SSX86_008202 [Deinandra increscens subsp. villosa]|uniref:RRM domain-containing protein n=1 Tax=Deinandra increscens subsp. villosa TaxID=3103831 RepID=A0AAP0H1U8_9ASTR
MAEAHMPPKHSSDESVKLFAGQVPKHMTEAQLISMFKEFSLVDQVNIIKDKATRASRGCCFVVCPSREEADKAVDAFHNKRTLPGASSPLQVKYADGELERLEHKIFIGMLPKNVSEGEVAALFSQYGTIKDLQILRGSSQQTIGCAFVKYETKEQAVAAIEGLNGKHKMEGSTVPLVLKWADTEKERQARKAQRAQTLANVDPSQHPSLFGALPMGYMSPYNGYGYQATGTYGLMQYGLPMVQNQLPFTNLSPNQANTLRAGSPRNYTVPAAGYMGSAYPNMPRLQYPLAYRGGIRPFSGPSSPVLQEVATNNSAASPTVSGICFNVGPPGANLFIYHIPQEFSDEDLANTFQAFGRVLSSKVFVDKATGVSKCFGMDLNSFHFNDIGTLRSLISLLLTGFVSYDSPTAAQSAINTMTGYQLRGKKLKVQLKRDNKIKLTDLP